MRHQRRDSLFSETVSGFVPQIAVLVLAAEEKDSTRTRAEPPGKNPPPASPPAVMARFRRGVGVAREGQN